MRELSIAAVWLIIAVGLFIIEPEVTGDYLPYVARGKWVALILAAMNAMRPLVKLAGMWFFRRMSSSNGRNQPLDPAPAPKPVLHPEFQVNDDSTPPPSPESPPPPGSFKSS